MAVRFRNVDVDPASPVAQWPFEALVTALERGALSDWRRIAREIDAHPWGRVARGVESYLAYERPYGVAPLMEEALVRARRRRERDEKEQVASLVSSTVDRSGLSRAEFAQAIGTSASRLSTYCSGKVTPSAAMLVRILDVVGGDAPGACRLTSTGSSERTSGMPSD